MSAAHQLSERPSNRCRALLRGLCVGTHTLKVVKIEKHRRTFSVSAEQVSELAECVRPDRVAVVRNQKPSVSAFTGKHVEVISPKINHHLLELSLAVDSAQDPRHL